MRALLGAASALALTVVVAVGAPTGAATTRTVASTCGYTVIGGKAYRCTFDDEFSTTRLDTTKWIVNTGFVTGSPTGYGCTVNDPRYVYVSNGALHLTAARSTTPVPCNNGYAPSHYEAPTVSTWHTFSQQYGRFEVRMRTTATIAPGLQEDFWMWPDDRYATINWPTSGEIDVAETYSNYSGLAIPYLHYTATDNLGPVPGVNTAWTCVAQRGVWNTYDLDWTSTTLTISVNGTTCLVNNSADPAFQKRYLMMLSQAIGLGTNAMTPATTLPATTDVDYVRVWQSM